MREHDAGKKGLFGKLVGFAFDHHDRVIGAGDDHLDVGALEIVEARIDDKLAIDVADANRADRTFERNLRNRQCRRSADDREDGRIVDLIGREHRVDDLDFRPISLREERANRAVGQAGGENGILGRPTFALDETAGDLAGRVHLFFVINREREEVDRLAGFLLTDHGSQHHRVAVANHDRAVRLFGQQSRFKGKRTPRYLERDGVDVLTVVHEISLAHRPFRQPGAAAGDPNPFRSPIREV